MCYLGDENMRTRMSSILLAGVLSILPLHSSTAQEREECRTTISHDWHDEALELVFPREDISTGWAHGFEYQLVVRVTSVDPGSQYIIQATSEGSFRVLSQTLATGQKSVWVSGGDWLAYCDLEPGAPEFVSREVAERIIVCTESVEVSKPAMAKIMHQFSRMSISPLIVRPPQLDGMQTIYVDGRLYDIWFESTAGKYHMELDNGASAERDDYRKIINWIEDLEQLIQSYRKPDPKNCRPAVSQTPSD